MALGTNKLEFFQSGAWNAATIACRTDKQAAISIINEMSLDEKNCDHDDWCVFLPTVNAKFCLA